MKEVGPQEAYELLRNDPQYIYLDVRSVPEFDACHAAGAINIPLMHFDPMRGMYPNEDFLAVVEANLPKDAKLIVGCKSGVRSTRACEVLARLGYTDVANMRGGFVGAADDRGQVIEPGWSLLNLPVSVDFDDDAAYEALKAKAGK